MKPNEIELIDTIIQARIIQAMGKDKPDDYIPTDTEIEHLKSQLSATQAQPKTREECDCQKDSELGCPIK